MNEVWKERLQALRKNGGWQKILITLGLLGMALILLSQLLPKKQPAQSTPELPAAISVTLTADEYAHTLELRLVEAVRNIAGVGSCSAMVTLENGVEYVYASQQKKNSDRKEGNDQISQREDNELNVILVDTGTGRQGLVVTEIQPTVKGVVVVCEGGDQKAVSEQVIKAVTTALNLSSRRVCVTKLSA